MTTLFYYAVCLVLGSLMTFHVSMNARVGTLVGNPFFANMIFWILGTIVAVFTYFIHGEKVGLAQALEVPLWLYTAGILGVGISLGIVCLIPKVGIAGFTIIILIGQLICSGTMGATGCLSDGITPINPAKLIGYLLTAVGGYLVIAR